MKSGTYIEYPKKCGILFYDWYDIPYAANEEELWWKPKTRYCNFYYWFLHSCNSLLQFCKQFYFYGGQISTYSTAAFPNCKHFYFYIYTVLYPPDDVNFIINSAVSYVLLFR